MMPYDVKTREDFILFLKELKKDFDAYWERNKDKHWLQTETGGWQQYTIGGFLDVIAAWLETSKVTEKHKQKNELSWQDLAEIIYIGKIYE